MRVCGLTTLLRSIPTELLRVGFVVKYGIIKATYSRRKLCHIRMRKHAEQPSRKTWDIAKQIGFEIGIEQGKQEEVRDMVKWLEEDCPHVSHSREKHWCGECWQAFKESRGIE